MDVGIAGPKAILREIDELIAALRAIQPGTPANDPKVSELLDRQEALSKVIDDSLHRIASSDDKEIVQISRRWELFCEALADIMAGGFWRTPE